MLWKHQGEANGRGEREILAEVTTTAAVIGERVVEEPEKPAQLCVGPQTNPKSTPLRECHRLLQEHFLGDNPAVLKAEQ